PAPFTLADGGQVDTPFMRKYEERFAYAALDKDGQPVDEGYDVTPPGDGFKVIELPYRGREVSMVVLLPNTADGLPALESRLSAVTLAVWLGRLTPRQVNVMLPRFELETSFDLVPTLKAMGMTDAFDAEAADFTGMSTSAGAEELKLAAAVHKAFVKVDEKGTEAAAATGVVADAMAARFTPSFTADHPFVFLIQDRDTRCVLFLGRVTRPTAGG
ncbi:MAG: serpin family protein, partial [Planctomycetota bacterium]